jgi:hypothetical protein
MTGFDPSADPALEARVRKATGRIAYLGLPSMGSALSVERNSVVMRVFVAGQR